MNPLFLEKLPSQTRQQSLLSTTGRQNLDEAQAMKSTQNLLASHTAEELSDEQLETIAAGGDFWPLYGRGRYYAFW